jgi:hypothetical protein
VSQKPQAVHDAAGEAREMRARLDAAEAAIRFRDEVIAICGSSATRFRSNSPPHCGSPISG